MNAPDDVARTGDPGAMERGARLSRSPAPPKPGLPAFLALTFVASWICWIPLAAFPLPAPARQALALLGTITPSLVALMLASRTQGRAGVDALLQRVTQGQVAARWYVFALGYTAAVKLVVALLHRLIAGAWPRFGDTPWFIIPFAIAISTPVQAGEEIGWRGFALPRLGARFGLAPASLLLGVIWAFWHLPLFFVGWADKHGQSFVVYALQVTALSVAFAWLYARTGGSLLLCMLLHAAVNNTKDIVPSVSPGATNVFGLDASLVAWLTVAVLWVFGAYFLAWMARTESRRAGGYLVGEGGAAAGRGP